MDLTYKMYLIAKMNNYFNTQDYIDKRRAVTFRLVFSFLFRSIFMNRRENDAIVKSNRKNALVEIDYAGQLFKI